MAADDVAAKSRAIVEQLDRLEAVRGAAAVLCYVSSKDNEVDTHGLIERLLGRGAEVLVPVSQPEGVLAWSRIEGLDELVPGRFGILEPKAACLRIASSPPHAAVVVPGIAFAPEGYRIGYGGGYYDRFLAKHPGPKIGLAFACQIIPAFEHGPHDVPVDSVVTENDVYRDRAD